MQNEEGKFFGETRVLQYDLSASARRETEDEQERACEAGSKNTKEKGLHLPRNFGGFTKG